MKLFWSSRSPYVRVVMMMAHEVGVADRIEFLPVAVTPYAVEPTLLPHNPLGRVPTLVLDDGGSLIDTRAICEYFDGFAPQPISFPIGSDALIIGQAFAIGDGLMDLGTMWTTLRFRTNGSVPEEYLSSARIKLVATFDRLERTIGEWSGGYDLGTAMVASALAYFDFRHGSEDWRAGRPRLAEWHATFSERASMRATQFVDS